MRDRAKTVVVSEWGLEPFQAKIKAFENDGYIIIPETFRVHVASEAQAERILYTIIMEMPK